MDTVGEIERALSCMLKAKGQFKFDGAKFIVEKPTKEQAIAKAYALLRRRGITSQPGFKTAWKLQLALLGQSGTPAK